EPPPSAQHAHGRPLHRAAQPRSRRGDAGARRPRAPPRDDGPARRRRARDRVAGRPEPDGAPDGGRAVSRLLRASSQACAAAGAAVAALAAPGHEPLAFAPAIPTVATVALLLASLAAVLVATSRRG